VRSVRWTEPEDAVIREIALAARVGCRMADLEAAWTHGRFPNRTLSAVYSRLGKLNADGAIYKHHVVSEPRHNSTEEKWVRRDHRWSGPPPIARPSWFDEPKLADRLMAGR
jgi:hypothetical protein